MQTFNPRPTRMRKRIGGWIVSWNEFTVCPRCKERIGIGDGQEIFDTNGLVDYVICDDCAEEEENK